MIITEWIEWLMEQGKYNNCKTCAQESFQKPPGSLPDSSRIFPGILQEYIRDSQGIIPGVFLEFLIEFSKNSPVFFWNHLGIFPVVLIEICPLNTLRVLIQFPFKFPLEFYYNLLIVFYPKL